MMDKRENAQKDRMRLKRAQELAKRATAESRREDFDLSCEASCHNEIERDRGG